MMQRDELVPSAAPAPPLRRRTPRLGLLVCPHEIPWSPLPAPTHRFRHHGRSPCRRRLTRSGRRRRPAPAHVLCSPVRCSRSARHGGSPPPPQPYTLPPPRLCPPRLPPRGCHQPHQHASGCRCPQCLTRFSCRQRLPPPWPAAARVSSPCGTVGRAPLSAAAPAATVPPPPSRPPCPCLTLCCFVCRPPGYACGAVGERVTTEKPR
jgi:hypothetical protein